jgi:hypothetical protein
MKVKDIVREDGPMQGQPPQMGKVTAQQPGVNGAPGMVTVTMSNGMKQIVPSNMIGTGPDGKPMINTQQQQPGSPQTSPAPTGSNGQPPVTMGQDLKVQEEPSNSTNTVNVVKKGTQIFASDGDPIEQTSTGREVDQQYIADPANATNRMGYIVANGKKYLALNTGHKWKVGPKVYSEITGFSHLPGDPNKQYAPPQPIPNAPLNQKSNPGNFSHLEESTDLSRIKMLSGLK